MQNQPTALKGAIYLAFLHFLLELWRGFLDFAYVLPEFSNGKVGNTVLFALVYTLIFAGWLLALQSASQSRRRGIIAAIGFSALYWIGVDISTIFFYCPGGCEEAIFDYSTYTTIVIGALALFSLVRNLRRPVQNT